MYLPRKKSSCNLTGLTRNILICTLPRQRKFTPRAGSQMHIRNIYRVDIKKTHLLILLSRLSSITPVLTRSEKRESFYLRYWSSPRRLRPLSLLCDFWNRIPNTCQKPGKVCRHLCYRCKIKKLSTYVRYVAMKAIRYNGIAPVAGTGLRWSRFNRWGPCWFSLNDFRETDNVQLF